MLGVRLAALLVTLALAPHPVHQASLGPVAYRGTGAWIDRYDFEKLGDPELAVATMADHGVRTLYVETASWKVPPDVDIVAPDATDALITAAHAYGLRVVAWYLPGFVNPAADQRRIAAALAFRTTTGQAFDSFALDIEANGLNPVARRNAALLRLSRWLRTTAGPGYPLGAIVPDQLSTSSGNVLWPRFPYAASARYFDVFLPMAYSTLGRASGASRVYAYTAANVRFVRRATHRPVHVIGGVTDRMSAGEQVAVARAARAGGAIGASLYKYSIYGAGSWAGLAAFR